MSENADTFFQFFILQHSHNHNLPLVSTFPLSNTTFLLPHHLNSSWSLLSEDSSSNSSYIVEDFLTYLVSNIRNDHIIQKLLSRLPWEIPTQSIISLKFYELKTSQQSRMVWRMLRVQVADWRQLLGIPKYCGKGVVETATGLRTPKSSKFVCHKSSSPVIPVLFPF